MCTYAYVCVCVCVCVCVYLCSVYVVAFRESRLYVGWCVLLDVPFSHMVQYAVAVALALILRHAHACMLWCCPCLHIKKGIGIHCRSRFGGCFGRF